MDRMSGSSTAPHTLEFTPACKQLSLILLAIHLVSFTVTWYQVWWDSIIGVAVAVWGYYTLFDTNPAHLSARRVRYFHYGTITSLVSHVIALGVTSYYVVKVYLFKDILGEDNSPGVTLFVFLYIFLMLMIAVTAFAIERTYNLCAELARNDYFLLNDGRA